MTRSLSHRWGPPLTILLALLALIAPGMTEAGEVRIAVAANFAAPMKSIAAQFERGTGHRLLLAPGATGQLYAQIRNGAPFDILLSADETTPAKLESEGLGVAGSRFTYAIGRLVLWSRTSGFVDARGDVLRSGQFTRIAIANPKLAPYGAAALATLERMGLGDRIAPRIVEGTNISQTFQFVATGNAPLGFVALSQVLENGALKSGSGWVVPDSMHPPIRQNAILLNRARGQAAATALLDYLKGEQARAIIRSFGYGV